MSDSVPAAAAGGAGDAPAVKVLALNCSEAERAALEAFRPKVADASAAASPLWRSDAILLRFLRARKLDLAAAEAMYRDVIKWRAEVGADAYLATYKEPEVMRRFCYGGYHGVDLDGNALIFDRSGQMDIKGMAEAIGEDDYLKWVIYYHERQEEHVQRLSEEAGEYKIGLTVISDLHGLSLRHFAPKSMGTAQKRTRLEEDHYPETAKRMFIVRAPRLFTAIFNIVKGFMDEGTRQKIFVLGDDYMDTLTKYVSRDNIPKYLGGNCACEGDPECRSKISAGGMVPASMRAGLPVSSEEVEVKAGGSNVSHLVVEAGSKVTWNFKVPANDVNFFVYYTPLSHESTVDMTKLSAPPTGATVVVAPSKTTAGHGEYVVAADGHVTLVWDNTFSWFSSKTVLKSVEIVAVEGAAAAAPKAE